MSPRDRRAAFPRRSPQRDSGSSPKMLEIDVRLMWDSYVFFFYGIYDDLCFFYGIDRGLMGVEMRLMIFL